MQESPYMRLERPMNNADVRDHHEKRYTPRHQIYIFFSLCITSHVTTVERGLHALLRAHAGQIRLPSLLLVLLSSLNRVRSGIDTTTRDNEVGTAANSRLRCLVLLTELIALRREVDTSGEDDEVLALGGRLSRLDLTQRAGGDKAQNKAGVLARDVNGGGGVGACCEGSLGGHLGEDEEAALGAVGEVSGLGGLCEGLDDALARKDGAVDYVGPFRDAEGAVVVLFLDCVADVDEFAVFEDEEVVLLG